MLDVGVNARLGNAKFDDDRVTFQLVIENKDAKREVERDLPHMADLYNLDTTKIGKHKGKSYSLVGYKRRARKEPWVIQDLQTGKEYIIGLSYATHLFAIKEDYQKEFNRIKNNFTPPGGRKGKVFGEALALFKKNYTPSCSKD